MSELIEYFLTILASTILAITAYSGIVIAAYIIGYISVMF